MNTGSFHPFGGRPPVFRGGAAPAYSPWYARQRLCIGAYAGPNGTWPYAGVTSLRRTRSGTKGLASGGYRSGVG